MSKVYLYYIEDATNSCQRKLKLDFYRKRKYNHNRNNESSKSFPVRTTNTKEATNEKETDITFGFRSGFDHDPCTGIRRAQERRLADQCRLWFQRKPRTNFVKVTANGGTLHIEAKLRSNPGIQHFRPSKKSRNSSDWAGRTYATDMGDYCTFSYDLFPARSEAEA